MVQVQYSAFTITRAKCGSPLRTWLSRNIVLRKAGSPYKVVQPNISVQADGTVPTL